MTRIHQQDTEPLFQSADTVLQWASCGSRRVQSLVPTGFQDTSPKKPPPSSRYLPADSQDRDGAHLVLTPLSPRFPRLPVIWADQGGYQGPQLGDWVFALMSWVLVIFPCPPGATGFPVLPKRWLGERTFAWLGPYRRLSKNCEGQPATSEAWIYMAMIDRMLHRLTAT